MKEVKGNIWEHHWKGSFIVIPTNGFVKGDGECIMGKGLAFQAKQKFPNLPLELGIRIQRYDNVVFVFWKYKLITFPVKRVWWERALLGLIEESSRGLQEIFKYNLSGIPTPVYLPRVGCGNGKLDWNDVKPILEKYLDDRFIVCDFIG